MAVDRSPTSLATAAGPAVQRLYTPAMLEQLRADFQALPALLKERLPGEEAPAPPPVIEHELAAVGVGELVPPDQLGLF